MRKYKEIHSNDLYSMKTMKITSIHTGVLSICIDVQRSIFRFTTILAMS